jgi:hypothetical protein
MIFRILGVVTMLASAAWAQSAAINGQIEGTITDASGAVVANAEVEIVNLDNGFKRAGTTDGAGFYRFVTLPLGSYEVNAKGAGFRDVKAKGVALTAGSTAVVNLTLTVGTAATVIEVGATGSIVEPGKTDLGYTLGGRAITNLPLVTRNTYNFILAQPNVSGHPQNSFGVPRKINANGFGDRINYQLDGSNNTQSDRAGIRLMPISNTFLAEIQQVSNGFSPEFGNTVGTVFNAITKSGTNELHGEGAYIFRRGPLNARPTLLTAAQAKPKGFLDSMYINTGGALKKDKLFFFGAFEHVRNDLSVAVTVPASTIAALNLPARFADVLPTVEQPYFVFTRFDWMINSKHQMFVRYNHFRNEQPYNNGGGQTVESRTVLFWDRVHAVGTQLVSTLSPSTVNEFRFQLPYRSQQNRRADFSGTGPAITISGLINFGAPTVAGFSFTERMPEFSDNLSFNRGTHSYKFGGTIRRINDNNTQATAATYTFANLAAYQSAVSGANPKAYNAFAQTVGEPALIYNSLFSSFYAQDSWKARPNLTLVYGLRYDRYRVPEADKQSPFELSRSFRTDNNNFAPRLGISYAFGKDQKTVIRANGGIFFDPPQVDVYRRAILSNGNPRFFNVSTGPATSFAPNFPNVFTGVPSGFAVPTQDIVTVSPDFRTLYSGNANLQISREIARNTSVNLGYLFTKGTGLPVYRNTNLIPTANRLPDGRTIFGAGRIDPRFNNVAMAEATGNSNYNGMNLGLNRRSAQWEMFATYTWSHAIDDAPEQNVLDSGALLPQDTLNRRLDRATSYIDRTHVLVVSSVFNPSFQTTSRAWGQLLNHHQLSFLYSARSGDIFSMGSNRVLNGDQLVPAAQQRPLYVGRNTIRGPMINHLDIRYARSFPITERFKVEFLAESSNFLNSSNITGLNTIAQVDVLGNITTPMNLLRTASLPPRQIQFGFRVRY